MMEAIYVIAGMLFMVAVAIVGYLTQPFRTEHDAVVHEIRRQAMKNIGKREVVSLMDDNKVEPDPLPNWASDESPVTELEALRITALLQDETIVNIRRLLWRAKQSRRRLVGHIVRLRKDRARANAVIREAERAAIRSACADAYNAVASLREQRRLLRGTLDDLRKENTRLIAENAALRTEIDGAL